MVARSDYDCIWAEDIRISQDPNFKMIGGISGNNNFHIFNVGMRGEQNILRSKIVLPNNSQCTQLKKLRQNYRNDDGYAVIDPLYAYYNFAIAVV